MNTPCIACKVIPSALLNFLLFSKNSNCFSFHLSAWHSRKPRKHRLVSQGVEGKDPMSFRSLRRINSIFCHDLNKYTNTH